MATLQKIRNKAGLLAIIIGLALFAFIIGDFLNSGSSLFKQSQRKIAKVGDYALDYEDYEARISEMEEVYKIQTGQSSLDEATSSQIRESVFQNIVREQLLDKQAEQLGVTVSGKELFALINGANVHPMIQQLPIFTNPQTGQFDRSLMMNFLQTIQAEDLSAYPAEAQEQIQQLKKYWLFWENSLKYNRLEEKINILLSKAVQANSLDAKANFDERTKSVHILYTAVPYTSLSDESFKASDSDIKKRYNANKERFAQEPFRSAKYVLVNINPSAEDHQAVEKKIFELEPDFVNTTDYANFVTQNSDDKYMDCYLANSLFQGKVKEFVSGGSAYLAPVFDNGTFVMAKAISRTVAPDSVKAKQIVLSKEESTRADSLLNVLNAGGDFNKLAGQFNRSGGNPEMGWFREMDAISMGVDFVRACFSASLNKYFIVKGKNSISIVQVTDKTAPVSKTKLALIALKVTPSSETYSTAYNKLNQLLATNKDANAFFANAEKNGYQVQDVPVVRKTDLTFANIPEMRQAVRFVQTNDLGVVSPILENQNNQFLVVGVTAVNDEPYLNLDFVKPVLAKEIVDEYKADKIMNDIRSLNASSLSAVAEKMKSKVDSAMFINFGLQSIQNIGDEPALIAAVTQAPAKKLSGPVKGKNGVFMFQVEGGVQSSETFNLKQEASMINSMNVYRVIYQSFDALKKAVGVQDNRIKFY